MRAAFFFVALGALFFANPARSQECPSQNPPGTPIESVKRTLAGQLVYHDAYRQWLGLKLDAPVCGVQEVELVDLDWAGESPKVQHLEVYRGCRIRTTGVLDMPRTTYFSAKVYQVVNEVAPLANCHLKPRFPDYAAIHPALDVRSYRVQMRLNYKTVSPLHVSVLSGGHRLFPTQVYAPYSINGSFSIEATCGDGFRMSRVRGTPEGHPFETDETAWIDPESAAAKGVWEIGLSYTCRR